MSVVHLHHAESACESPIEVAFMRALVAAADERRISTSVCIGPWPPSPSHTDWYEVTPRYAGRGLCIHCQPQIEKMRFDFILEFLELRSHSTLMVVECDGHDYHERTKDQAARDRARDRQASIWGLHPFRFTGREIHRDALACADQCLDFLQVPR